MKIFIFVSRNAQTKALNSEQIILEFLTKDMKKRNENNLPGFLVNGNETQTKTKEKFK